ncbi:MAG: hypothetical protein IKM43_00640 [Clostridia bacterium]|nr:hypothetical protein [Clostridia bacterium]
MFSFKRCKDFSVDIFSDKWNKDDFLNFNDVKLDYKGELLLINGCLIVQTHDDLWAFIDEDLNEFGKFYSVQDFVVSGYYSFIECTNNKGEIAYIDMLWRKTTAKTQSGQDFYDFMFNRLELNELNEDYFLDQRFAKGVLKFEALQIKDDLIEQHPNLGLITLEQWETYKHRAKQIKGIIDKKILAATLKLQDPQIKKKLFKKIDDEFGL